MRVIKLEISRFPHKELPYMPGSQTTQGRLDTRAGVSDRVAFRVSYLVGALRFITFAAQWLAYTLPCRRFTDILAEACARLGGQCGSLLLHCDGLAPSTPCRSPGAQHIDSMDSSVRRKRWFSRRILGLFRQRHPVILLPPVPAANIQRIAR